MKRKPQEASAGASQPGFSVWRLLGDENTTVTAYVSKAETGRASLAVLQQRLLSPHINTLQTSATSSIPTSAVSWSGSYARSPIRLRSSFDYKSVMLRHTDRDWRKPGKLLVALPSLLTAVAQVKAAGST